MSSGMPKSRAGPHDGECALFLFWSRFSIPPARMRRLAGAARTLRCCRNNGDLLRHDTSGKLILRPGLLFLFFARDLFAYPLKNFRTRRCGVSGRCLQRSHLRSLFWSSPHASASRPTPDAAFKKNVEHRCCLPPYGTMCTSRTEKSTMSYYPHHRPLTTSMV